MDLVIRDWTFTHWWVRPVVKVWFNFYHKSVTYSGTEHLNWDKPLIFAPTHQSAFSDALCLILPTKYTNDRFIYPLIRADAFGNNAALDWMLTVFHMMPVYRPRDNVNLKQENESVFAHCHEMLAKKRNLLIHPEGNCIPQKKVRRFKKGLARIALGAEQAHDFDLGIEVVPVGINYRNNTESREGIHIRFGTPVPVSDFAEVYRGHPASGITRLTQAVKDGVEKVAINIKSDKHYHLAEQCMRMAVNVHPEFANTPKYTERELQFNRDIVSAMSEKSETTTGFMGKLKQKVEHQDSQLNSYNLDWAKTLVDNRSVLGLLAEGVISLLLLPVIIYGWINNGIPWFLSQKVGDYVKDKQFISSARMVTGLLLFPLIYLLQSLFVYFFTYSWIWVLLYLVSLPISGIIGLNSWERFKDWSQQVRLKLLSRKEKETLLTKVRGIFTDLDIQIPEE